MKGDALLREGKNKFILMGLWNDPRQGLLLYRVDFVDAEGQTSAFLPLVSQGAPLNPMVEECLRLTLAAGHKLPMGRKAAF